MKKLTLMLIAFTLSVAFVYSAPNKSFKLGMPYSTAQFMMDDTKLAGRTLTPTLGLSYFGISNTSKYSNNGESDESSMSVHFLIPRLEARVAGERVGDLNTYTYGEAFMVIPIITGSDLDNEDKDQIKDATDLLGLTVGSGVEYYFSDSFSIGGELSFNMLFHSTSYEDSYDDYKSEFSTRLGATLTQVTFNYYFQKD